MNPCGSSPCENEGTCTNGYLLALSGYVCECAKEFRGDNCEAGRQILYFTFNVTY